MEVDRVERRLMHSGLSQSSGSSNGSDSNSQASVPSEGSLDFEVTANELKAYKIRKRAVKRSIMGTPVTDVGDTGRLTRDAPNANKFFASSTV